MQERLEIDWLLNLGRVLNSLSRNFDNVEKAALKRYFDVNVATSVHITNPVRT
jgi:hypothetical protein